MTSAITALLADLVSDAFMQSASIADVAGMSPNFVRVELYSEAFRTAKWTPGDKLQLRPRRGTFQVRTYTPINWDAKSGATELIAFNHGDGPAATWFRGIAVGDNCEAYGPRSSVDLSAPGDSTLFIGDESSVGLACAVRNTSTSARYIFEAVDPSELAGVLTSLGFCTDEYVIVGRNMDRVSLLQHGSDAAAASAGAFDLVVSGDAASVGIVRRAARAWPRAPRRIKAKAYWATGRTGLD